MSMRIGGQPPTPTGGDGQVIKKASNKVAEAGTKALKWAGLKFEKGSLEFKKSVVEWTKLGALGMLGFTTIGAEKEEQLILGGVEVLNAKIALVEEKMKKNGGDPAELRKCAKNVEDAKVVFYTKKMDKLKEKKMLTVQETKDMQGFYKELLKAKINVLEHEITILNESLSTLPESKLTDKQKTDAQSDWQKELEAKVTERKSLQDRLNTLGKYKYPPSLPEK